MSTISTWRQSKASSMKASQQALSSMVTEQQSLMCSIAEIQSMWASQWPKVWQASQQRLMKKAAITHSHTLTQTKTTHWQAQKHSASNMAQELSWLMCFTQTAKVTLATHGLAGQVASNKKATHSISSLAWQTLLFKQMPQTTHTRSITMAT